jgi:hypothetical protein
VAPAVRQSALDWQVRALHVSAPHAAFEAPQQASPVPQSSTPSQLATAPLLHDAPTAWQIGSLIGPAQHCMSAPQLVLPHFTPSGDPDPEPASPPLQMPAMHA